MHGTCLAQPSCVFRALIVCVFLAPAAQAQAVRLDLSEATRRAERNAPELGPHVAAVNASREVARAASAILPAPPRLELAAGPRWHTEPSGAGIDLSAGLWQDLPLGGVIGARRRLAGSLRSEARARLEVARHDVRLQAALAWVDARLGAEVVEIRRRSLAEAVEILRIATARVRAGSAPPAEETLARSVRGRARADLLAAQGRRFVAETRLRHLTGIARKTPIVLVGALDAAEGPVLGDQCQSPDLAVADARARRRAVDGELTRAAGRPMLGIGPSVTREATGDWIVLGRLSIPLPIVDPVAVESARARSEARVARAEATALRSVLEREIALATEERRHAREVRRAIAKEVLGPAREAVRQTLAQYAAGSIDAAALLAARRELADAEQTWAEAAAEVRRADLTMARVLGCGFTRRDRR